MQCFTYCRMLISRRSVHYYRQHNTIEAQIASWWNLFSNLLKAHYHSFKAINPFIFLLLKVDLIYSFAHITAMVVMSISHQSHLRKLLWRVIGLEVQSNLIMFSQNSYSDCGTLWGSTCLEHQKQHFLDHWEIFLVKEAEYVKYNLTPVRGLKLNNLKNYLQ
jgi:hypothetical protein